MALFRFFFAPALLAVAVLAGRVEKARAPDPSHAAVRTSPRRTPAAPPRPSPRGGEREARGPAPIR